MQLTLDFPSPNQFSDAIHGILGQRFTKKNHICLFNKKGVFNYFRQKLAGGKVSTAKNFVQLRRFQCSFTKEQKGRPNTFAEKERQI